MSDKIVFGLATYKNAVAGLHLQTVNYGESASSAEATDEDGYIEQIDVYAKKRTIQCDGNVTVDADLSALTVGGSLTVDGKTYQIDSVSIREAANGHKPASISGSAPMEKPAGVGG